MSALLLLAATSASVAGMGLGECVSQQEIFDRSNNEGLVAAFNEGPDLTKPLRVIYLIKQGATTGYLIKSEDGVQFCKLQLLSEFSPYRLARAAKAEAYTEVSSPQAYVNQRVRVNLQAGLKPIFSVWAYGTREVEGSRLLVMAASIERGAATATVISSRAGARADGGGFSGQIRNVAPLLAQVVMQPEPIRTAPTAPLKPASPPQPAWCSQRIDEGGKEYTGAQIDRIIASMESATGAPKFEQAFMAETKANAAEARSARLDGVRYYRILRKKHSGADQPQGCR